MLKHHEHRGLSLHDLVDFVCDRSCLAAWLQPFHQEHEMVFDLIRNPTLLENEVQLLLQFP
jgi:hypothetical protein